MSEEKNINAAQAQLLAQAETIEAGNTGQAEQEAQAQADAASAADENKAILQTVIAMLAPAMPFLAQCYPPPVIERIAYAYTAVEEKYGWNVRNMLGVEAQLAIVAIPPTVQAIVLGRAYFAAKREEARANAAKVVGEGEADGNGK